MNRHAYLIMAHSNPSQLIKLLTLLDDDRNDIFLHIDAKADIDKTSFVDVVKRSKLITIEAIPVFWAEYSQVEVELRLLEAAIKENHYKYYHLLSGMDLPIKTQDQIHSFFENEERLFIGTAPGEGKYQLSHVMYSYPLLKLKTYKKSIVLKVLNEVLVQAQKILHINNVSEFMRDGMHFYDGWTWFSITDDFSRYVLQNEKLIEQIFKRAKAPDEMFLQTLAMNSHFKDRLACLSSLKDGSMRCIDWTRGKPYTYKISDFDELMSSPYLFARKFDENVDNDIIIQLYNNLKR